MMSARNVGDAVVHKFDVMSFLRSVSVDQVGIVEKLLIVKYLVVVIIIL